MRPAAIEEDLRRRDVTVNAIALDLRTAALLAAEHALDDLAAGRLRVLHDASLRDDPTRLWRIARYAARLGFELEPHTAQLAADAVAAGAVERVSGARIGNELRLALAEPDAVAALEAAVSLGLAPWLAPDRARADASLGTPARGRGTARSRRARPALHEGADDADQRLAGMAFTASERAVLRAAARAPAIAAAALAAQRPSELARALRGLPVEALALAGPDGAAEPVRRWLGELRHVGLAIDGNDLIAAGIAARPADRPPARVGARAQARRRARRDRGEQLAAALGDRCDMISLPAPSTGPASTSAASCRAAACCSRRAAAACPSRRTTR